MIKVKAKTDVYVEGTYRYEGEVFHLKGDVESDPNLLPVDEGTELGIPTPAQTSSEKTGAFVTNGTPVRPPHVGAPKPQVVFDFDEPGGSSGDSKPSSLDLFA